MNPRTILLDQLKLVEAPAGHHLLISAGSTPRYVFPKSGGGRRSGAQLFVSNVLKRSILDISCSLGFGVSLDCTPEFYTKARIKREHTSEFSIKIGTPGPYQKVTIAVFESDHERDRAVKLPLGRSSPPLIRHEAETLLWLAKQKALEGYIPRLIELWNHDELPVFAQTISRMTKPFRSSSTPQILTFLELLKKVGGTNLRLVDTNFFHNFKFRADSVREAASPAWQQRIKRVEIYLERRTGMPMHFCPSHGDFAHWNIGEVDGQIVVYDWEHFNLSYPKAYDFLHFLFIPRAAARKPLDDLVFSAREKYRLFFQHDTDNDFQEQLIFYLSDVSLLYLASNKGQDAGDVVVSSYGRLLDKLLQNAS